MLKKSIIYLFSLILVFGAVPILKLSAASLSTGSVSLSDSRINAASTTYTITFSGVTVTPIKCIKVAFSDAATAGSKPTGMTITSLALSATSNYIPTPASWSPSNVNATGISSITFATGETPASGTARTVVLTTITNGSVAGTIYFLQFSTYNNVDCVTTPVDSATIAYIYTNGQTVSASVDPTLTFSVAGVASAGTVNSTTTNITTTSTTIPFGTITASTNKVAAQDLSIATNAGSGYTVTIKYTGTFSNGGGGVITDWTGTNASPTTFSAAGTSAFGYTTEDAVLGTGTASRFTSNKWAGLTTSPLEIIYNAAAASDTVRIGFQAGIATTTPAGSYTTTVIYTATPIY
ncbi:MAG: hypothetical protein ACMG57_00785 [Candidatus Dojkabacteria bacterium]